MKNRTNSVQLFSVWRYATNRKIMKRFILLIALCILQIGCTNRSSSNKQDIEDPIVTEMKSKVTTDYIENIVKELVVPQFESIDTMGYRNYEPDKIISRLHFGKDEERGDFFYLTICGWVYGNVKGLSKKHYQYTIFRTITKDNIDNPLNELRRGMTIWDDNDEYIYYMGDDPVKATAQYKEFKRKVEEENKKSKNEESSEDVQKEENQFIIDGIKVTYSHRSSYTYIYKSEKRLKPDQILRVIKDIGDIYHNYNEEIKHIGFLVGDLDYAAYTYGTQCIFYFEPSELYKIINGEPVKLQ